MARDAKIEVRLPQTEKARYQAAAERDGLTLSELVRTLLRRHVELEETLVVRAPEPEAEEAGLIDPEVLAIAARTGLSVDAVLALQAERARP
jgi:hypothetical protein